MGQMQSFYWSRVENPSLFEKLDSESKNGFKNSVIRLYQDIIEFIKLSAVTGHRSFRYNKIWSEPGYIMSPIINPLSNIDNSIKCTNFVLSYETRQKLLEDVVKILTDEKIVARNSSCKTIEKDGMIYIEINIDLYLDMIPEMQSSTDGNSNLPPIDFKNSSC